MLTDAQKTIRVFNRDFKKDFKELGIGVSDETGKSVPLTFAFIRKCLAIPAEASDEDALAALEGTFDNLRLHLESDVYKANERYLDWKSSREIFG